MADLTAYRAEFTVSDEAWLVAQRANVEDRRYDRLADEARTQQRIAAFTAAEGSREANRIHLIRTRTLTQEDVAAALPVRAARRRPTCISL